MTVGRLGVMGCVVMIINKTVNLGPSDVIGPLDRFTGGNMWFFKRYFKPCSSGVTQMIHGKPPVSEAPNRIAQTDHITLNLNYPYYQAPPMHSELTAGHWLPYPWQDLKAMHDALWAKEPLKYPHK